MEGINTINPVLNLRYVLNNFRYSFFFLFYLNKPNIKTLPKKSIIETPI